MGDVAGTARVRVVPPLPWKFDFNKDKAVPLTWLGGRVRWELREKDGEKFIAKKTVLPTPKNPNNKLGTRSYVWMGPINLANYTIQADVLLERRRRQNVGRRRDRQRLPVDDPQQGHTLRLDSWTSNDYRTKVETEFQPKADTWYTLKLSVVTENGQATVRGKIWPRGEKEPDEWTAGNGRSSRPICTARRASSATRRTRKYTSTTCK